MMANTMWFEVLTASSLIQATSWTLLHFVWQAFVVTGLAAMGLMIARRCSPHVRYVWLVCCLIAVITSPAVTWCVTLTHYAVKLQSESRATVTFAAVPDDAIVERSSTWQRETRTFISEPDARLEARSAAGLLDRWLWLHGAVVGLWLASQLGFGLRMWLSAHAIATIRRTAVDVEQPIRQRAKRLAERLRTTCPAIRTSTLLASAVAAGFRDPVILLPAFWLSVLSPEMLDAVIAHEMAHVRRHDLWVNLLQRIVEALFCFHPAVWWLSARIRQERELCCDSMAITATRERHAYAKTLEFVARLSVGQRVLLTTQIGDDRMSLLKRVVFVLEGRTDMSTGWWPISILAAIVPATVLFIGHRATIHAQTEQSLPTTVRHELVEPSPHIDDSYGYGPLAEGKRANPNLALPQFTIEKPLERVELGPYIIDAPDVVEVAVTNLVEKAPNGKNHVPGSFTHVCLVQPDGMVNLGDYGKVMISGKTIEAARDTVISHLKKRFVAPTVSLEVREQNSKFFYLIQETYRYGEKVNELAVGPQPHATVARMPITGNETVLDGIAKIGGVESKHPPIIFLSRTNPDGNPIVAMIDWQTMMQNGVTDTNYQLLPGDRLFILDVELPERIAITQPVTSTSSEQMESLDTDALQEVLRSRLSDSTIGNFLSRGKVRIASEKVSDYDDPPRIYPLIGNTQLHHANFRCTIFLDELAVGDATPQFQFAVDQTQLRVATPVASAQSSANVATTTGHNEDTTTGGSEFAVSRDQIYVEVYNVADLLAPLSPHARSKDKAQSDPPNQDIDVGFDALIDLVKSTVSPDSWDEARCGTTIASFPSNLSLVVSQTQDVHEQIADLFSQLRRLQSKHIEYEITELKLSASVLKRLGIGGKKVAVLEESETRALIQHIENDPRARHYLPIAAQGYDGETISLGTQETSESENRQDPFRVQGVMHDNAIRLSFTTEGAQTTVAECQSVLLRCCCGASDNDTSKESSAWFRLVSAHIVTAAPEAEQQIRPREATSSATGTNK